MAVHGRKVVTAVRRVTAPIGTDLAILICRAQAYFREAYRFPKLYDPDNPVIDRVGLQGDAMTISVCTDNKRIEEDLQLFRQALSNDDELLCERLRL